MATKRKKRRGKEEKTELTLRILGIVGNLFDSILSILLVVVIIYFVKDLALKCYDYGYRIYTESAISASVGREVEIQIPVDFSAKQLGELFETNGLTRDSKLFMLQYYASEYKEDVRPGTYTLSTTMTAEEMFASIAEINIEKDRLQKELEEQIQAEKDAARAEEEAANEASDESDEENVIQEINMDGADSLMESEVK